MINFKSSLFVMPAHRNPLRSETTQSEEVQQEVGEADWGQISALSLMAMKYDLLGI